MPKSNPAGIHSVYDLRTKPVKLVIAAPAVPVGGYTRTVLRKMGLTSVLSKVVSQESDVKAVTGKVALGQADAGFVYVTDARPVGDRRDGDPHPGVGAAARALRDRDRLALDQQGGRAARGSRRCSAAKGQEALQERRLPPAPEDDAIAAAGVPRDARPRDGRRARASCCCPIAAIFLRVPPGDLLAALGTDAALDAIRVTLETNAISMVADPRLRDADRVLDRDPRVARSATSW